MISYCQHIMAFMRFYKGCMSIVIFSPPEFSEVRIHTPSATGTPIQIIALGDMRTI